MGIGWDRAARLVIREASKQWRGRLGKGLNLVKSGKSNKILCPKEGRRSLGQCARGCAMCEGGLNHVINKWEKLGGDYNQTEAQKLPKIE